MNNIFSVELLFLLKLLLLVTVFGYAVFSFVVLSQVIIMNRLFKQTTASSIVILAAIINLVVAGVVFIVAIGIL